MRGRPRKPWEGKPIANAPAGFPIYAKTRAPRVVTSDVWSYLKHTISDQLPAKKSQIASSFVDQAYEFFEAGSNPQLHSRPLLFYYSFLNLAKALVLTDGTELSPAPKHGISDPQVNRKEKLQFKTQVVRIVKCAHDHSKVFPELVKTLGGKVTDPIDFKVLDLLGQVPSIHRTYCRVTNSAPKFLPIKKIQLMRDSEHVWARCSLQKDDRDVKSTIGDLRKCDLFKHTFDQVESNDKNEIWFESGYLPGSTRAADQAIVSLSSIVANIGVWPILTSHGNRLYFSSIPEGQRLPALASIYAVVFYLGSLTRYKPYDYVKITNKYAWLIGEFLNTQPAQFLYGLASHMAGVEVVTPFAAARHISS